MTFEIQFLSIFTPRGFSPSFSFIKDPEIFSCFIAPVSKDEKLASIIIHFHTGTCKPIRQQSGIPRRGGNLVDLKYEEVPLFRGTFFLESAKLCVPVLKYIRSYGYHLKKHVELWDPFWKNATKCLLFIENCSLPC